MANSSARFVAIATLPFAVMACSSGEASETPVAVAQQALDASCGYTVAANVTKVSKKGFRARVIVTKTDGSKLDSSAFTVLVNSGAATLTKVGHGTFSTGPNGYILTTVPGEETDDESDEDGDPTEDEAVLGGFAYRFQLHFEGSYAQLQANLISSSGSNCDVTAPTVKLTTSSDLVTANGSLTLSAAATDNVGLAKVVFFEDGVELGSDATAPYSLSVPVTSAHNGRHRYTATAYDLTGNQGSETKRVLVAVGNKFFGTATSVAADYTNLTTYFDQITPANAGKWGSVEATRGTMNWTELDTAYQFAKAKKIPFKFHTLVWGQQQPAWLAALPPAEQLSELEQWMAAIAERYPDIDHIDVVNEPLHAPPSYAAALGGAGTTGWDWVVNAFEMARAHFPDAELLLNDYSILSMTSATQDYLKIINALKDRGLIDGIGEQGHFYERAPELSVLTTNLNSLIATGLPLYVSELDLNFADDARQANRMKDLFSLFWSKPTVLGITHWGYLEGTTWQPNTHLIRSNGSARPALTWIQCHRAGGSSCAVPAYVAQPRTGDANGITLQAEEYDAAQGLLPAGDVVAYASNGSWMRFDKVVFKNEWNKLDVTYAYGGTTPINVTVHLDSLSSAPVATVPLEPTGSWGTNKTASVAWSPLGVEKTVFVRFNGGGANIDKIAFAAPPAPTRNIVSNGTFEAGTAGWFTWGGATLSAATSLAHSGTKSLLVGSRTGNSPAAIDLTSSVKTGSSYPFSAWVAIRSADGASKSVNVTQATTCKAADGSSTPTYVWIAGPTTVAGASSSPWIQLSGTITVPNCTLTQLQLYIEGASGSELYVDDVQVLDASGSSNLITDGTFETGQGAWGGWGFSSLAVTATTAHSGAQSLRGATMSNGAITRDIRALVQPGKRYQATAWVSVGNLAAGSGAARLQTIQSCNGVGTDSYPWLAGSTVNNGAWAQLTGTVDLSACTSVEKLILFVGADSGDLYVDDVVLKPVP